MYIDITAPYPNQKATIRFYDKNNQELSFLRSTYETSHSDYGKGYSVRVGKDKIIVPEGAVKLSINASDSSLLYVNSIHLVDYQKRISSVRDLVDVSTETSHAATFVKDTSVVKTYFINEADQLVYTATGNAFTVSGLTSEVSTTYKIISVDNNFISSKPIYQRFVTKKN